MERRTSARARLATCAFVVGITPFSAGAAQRLPSRIALLVEGGTTWETHDPQSFLLADPSGREPLLEFDRGSAYGLALDIQVAPVLVLRTAYESSEPELSMTIFAPPGLDDDSLVARTRSESLRVGIFLHGSLKRDLFAPDAPSRVMGRFGLSVARSRLRSVELTGEAVEAFDVVSYSSRDAWVFALEAEFIARFGRSRWFGGVGTLFGVGPGPSLVVEPSAGSGFTKSEFEFRSNRLTLRLGYRF